MAGIMTQPMTDHRSAGAPASRTNADLSSAVAEAITLYTAANPQSQAKHLEAAGHMPGGNTRTVLFFGPFPLYFTRGDAQRLHDVDGHEYVDFLGEYTAGIYGHSHPVIAEAITGALAQGIALGGHTRHEVALSAALRARFPSVDLMRFCNSGTEANVLALSAARLFTGRPGVLAFQGCYHGSVFGFPYKMPAKSINLPLPTTLAPYNDLAATEKLLAETAGEIGCVIVEPMMGGGGCIPATKEFLAGLRAACDKHKIVLIFDEVMTSRLSPGGLQKVHGVTPDLTTFGKYIGGGLPTGAFGGRAEIMNMFDPRRPDAVAHAGTFNNNVLSMAAGLAGAKKLLTAQAIGLLNRKGDRLRNAVNEIAAKYDVGLKATGVGSFVGLHFTRNDLRQPGDLDPADAERRTKLQNLMHLDLIAAGKFYGRRGFIALMLPITEDDVDAFTGAVEEFVVSRKSLLA